jgi:hypothetical protein
MKRKTWQKSKAQLILEIGPCKHCGKNMVNTESFVVFADKTKAHYDCYKNDYEKASNKPQI